MPNFIRNKIMGLSEEQVKPYVYIKKDNTPYFDFNKFIPMPKELEIELSSDLMAGLDMIMKQPFDTTYVKCLHKDERHCFELGLKALLNLIHYDYMTWYCWSYNKWGTIWNSMDYEYHDNAMYISTADKPPLPVIQKLSEVFRTEITIIYADEFAHNHNGTATFANGQLVCQDIPEDGTKRHMEFFNEAWCRNYPIFQNEDGKWDIDRFGKNGE